MIVSASYKTDIPAFYGEWFMARVAAGFCRMTNPYGGQTYEVPLAPGAVDGIVFWTKNLAPFRDHLTDLRRRGFVFTVQYGITGLPRAFERSVVEATTAIAHMHDLAAAFGPRAAVWRYDPVLLSSLTPPAWHIENFSRLARALAGASDEVVVSFAQIYRKTRRNLMAAARAHDFTWRDPVPEEKLTLIAGLAEIAADHGMVLTLCTQPDLQAPGVRAARCIDAERLADVAGRPIAAKEKGNRPGCLCHASRDIGEYDTCPHGCVYCYAVQNRSLARRRQAAHDAEDEFLFRPPGAG